MNLTVVPAPKQWRRLLIHPLAALFPPLSREAFEQLRSSIAGGFDVRHAIVIYKGMIVDGRNRLQACDSAKAEPHFLEFEGTQEEMIDFILRENVCRRDLTCDAKAQIVLELEEARRAATAMKAVLPTKVSSLSGLAHTSTRTMERNIQARRIASPEDIKKIRNGELSAARVVAKAKEKTPTTLLIETDSIKRPIHPAAQVALTDGAKLFHDLRNQLIQTGSKIKALCATPNGRLLDWSALKTDLDNVIRYLRFCAPHTSCPMGDPCDDDCRLCRGTQWVGESQWEHIPAEFKK